MHGVSRIKGRNDRRCETQAHCQQCHTLNTWTVLSLIGWATDYFKKAGLASPRLDSEILLALTLGLKRMDLYLQFDRPLLPPELARFKQLLKRRMDREPMAYITGEKEFWSRSFSVGPGVLIPRPDTEMLIETALQQWKKNKFGTQDGTTSDAGPVVMDIGTGSGILAITLAKEIPSAKVVAVDISATALNYAMKNAQKHEVMDQITFLEKDFLVENFSQEKQFDLVVSNPPYVTTSEIENLEEDVKKFEPHLALDGDSDGLKFYRALAQKIPVCLKTGGSLMMEIGEDQAKSVESLFSVETWKDCRTIKDYAHHDRVVWAIKA